MYKVVLSEKGQICLPAALRRKLNLRRGDRLAVEEVEGAILLRPLPPHPLLALRGTLAGIAGERLTELLLRERAADQERERP